MYLPRCRLAGLDSLRQCEMTVDGMRIRYSEAGEGPPVLLLHGVVFAGNAFWLDTQAALAPHARTIAPDLPGWGDSDKPEVAYTAEFYHGFLEKFMDALNIDQAVLVGHSMGGLLSTSFALHHPGRLRGLVSVAAPPTWLDIEVPALFKPLLFPALGEGLLFLFPWFRALNPGRFRAYYESLFYDASIIPPDRLEAVVAEGCLQTTYACHRQAVLSTIRSNAGYCTPERVQAQRELVTGLKCPVLFIGGRHDPLFAPEMLERGAAACPGAVAEILEECGHFPMWEQADRTSAMLTRVVADCWKLPRAC